MYANMQVGEIFATINLLEYKDDDIPHAKKGRELGYIQSLSVTYGLNMIPIANITVPLGSTLNQDGSTSPSYVYGGSSDSLYKLGDDSTPVGIYVRGAFFDTTGSSNVQEFCILKGYVTDTAYERSAGTASMTVKLIHWLCHLTEFPLISPLLSPQTPADVAAQYPLALKEDWGKDIARPDWSENNVKFSLISHVVSSLQDISNGNTIWDTLKQLFIAINRNPTELKKEDPGYVSKPYLKRVSGALEAVVGSDLDFVTDSRVDYQKIKNAIAVRLSSLTCGYFNGSTIWDKMVNSFLPEFYMALVPRVCEANVIPAPGQCMGASKAKVISKSEYYQTNYSRVSFPTLFGGVQLYLDPIIYGTIDPGKCSVRFPQELQPGPLHVVSAPPWLTSKIVANVGMEILSTRGFYQQYKIDAAKRKTKAKESSEKEKENRGIIERILNNLVRITFQIMACSGRQIVVNMPLRMDLTPGELVCLELPSGVVEATQEYIYGTIDSVTLNISTGVASTNLVLSNIRTQKEMKNKDLTSSEGILYSKAWKSNNNLTLCERVI